MIKLIYALLFSCFTLVSSGQTKPDKDKEKINAICDKLMQNFRDGKIPEALQLLKQNSTIDHSAVDSLQETMISQMNAILPSYGRILSYEFIREKKIKDFLAKRFYMLKLEKYFLKFDFTIYKSSTGWTITNFTYNEDLIEVLN
ncbi:MAG TPA: hypothetical protein VFT15_14230 [Chitinophagaceae bacterium]|nr:hypothetical protein [Chitinophagaceae bacterium]